MKVIICDFLALAAFLATLVRGGGENSGQCWEGEIPDCRPREILDSSALGAHVSSLSLTYSPHMAIFLYAQTKYYDINR